MFVLCDDFLGDFSYSSIAQYIRDAKEMSCCGRKVSGIGKR